MKHPIAYRIVMYSCMALLICMMLIVLETTNYAPFNSIDMRLAYLNGCLMGDKTATFKCKIMSDLYFESLEDIDEQMEALHE